MITLLIALLFLLLAQGGTAAQRGAAAPGQAGDPHQAAKALWEGRETSCKNCHGVKGEGGYGPDLAGRKMTFEQFRHAVRKPWGIMPSFKESQVSDKEILAFMAWFESMPTVAQPGEWRFKLPEHAHHGQVVALESVGCAQCHGADLETPRHGAAEVNADFEWFKNMVYNHTNAQPEHWKLIGARPTPRVRMGTYSKLRLQESLVRDIWSYMTEEGFLVPVTAQLGAGVPGANGVTYTLNVRNSGLKGKGLAAEDVTISLVLPAGAKVVSTTGDGYKGVQHDEEEKADAAVWRVPRVGPADRQEYTITLSQAATAADNLRGTIRWEKHTPKTGHGAGETINIPPAPAGGRQQTQETR